MVEAKANKVYKIFYCITIVVLMDFLAWHKYNKECRYPNEYELTPYLSDKSNAPVVVVCPGGGYRMIASFIEGHPVARYFQEHGYNAFVLRYRVREKAHFPAPLMDIAHALSDIQTEYKLSLDNYALCGFSAGGHMCALFGVKEFGYGHFNLPKPQLLMLVYPVISLEKEFTHRTTRKWFAGEDDPEALEVGNIHHHIDKDYPTTFIWRGDKDRSVQPVNSDFIVKELEKNNIKHLYIKYPKVGHGVGLAKNTTAEGWADKAIEFWNTL